MVQIRTLVKYNIAKDEVKYNIAKDDIIEKMFIFLPFSNYQFMVHCIALHFGMKKIQNKKEH